MPANETIADGSGRFAARSMVRLGSLVVASIAIYLVVQAVGSLWGEFRKPHSIAVKSIISIFSLVLISICAFVAFVGYQSWFFVSATFVRWLCAIIWGFGCIFVMFTLGHAVFPRYAGSEVADGIFMLAGTIVAVNGYRWVVRWLLPSLGMQDDRNFVQRLHSAEWVFKIIGFQIWLTGSQVLDSVLQPNAIVLLGVKNGPGLLGMLAFLGPVLIAVLFYKIAVRMTTKRLLASLALAV